MPLHQLVDTMKNGIIGTHLATGVTMEIPFNSKEMQLAMVKDPKIINWAWETACDSVFERTGLEIINCFEIDFICINGKQKVFH